MNITPVIQAWGRNPQKRRELEFETSQTRPTTLKALQKPPHFQLLNPYASGLELVS